MTAIRRFGLLLVLLLPTAHALYLDKDGQTDGANGPTDHYLDASTGGHHFYDSATGVLTPAPTFASPDPLYLQGVKVSFYQFGQRMENITMDEVTCGKTFCLAFQMRLAGDWDGLWQYRFKGDHAATGLPVDWSSWSSGVATNGKGRPIVSGSDTYVAQPTEVLNCEVEAVFIASSTMGLPTVTSRVVTFQCAN